jgi:hypothetical protein
MTKKSVFLKTPKAMSSVLCRGKTSLFGLLLICSTASKVMITTGYPLSSARKTEIVDAANWISCSDLAEFPVELYGAVGGNLGGTPVVCGGFLYPENKEECFRFKNSVWEEYASMKEKRGHAAAVTHNDKLHVFGGISGSSLLQTTETINVDGEVSYGTHLPTGVYRHAMTKINDTVSLLSGGVTFADDYSAKTWYYNHDTEAFTSGPDLMEGRIWHGSAINVDKVTKAKIVVVTGGFKSKNLDSTEMLINGQWQTGTIQCRKQKYFLFPLVLYFSDMKALLFHSIFFCSH